MQTEAEIITCDFQPYGPFTIRVEQEGQYNGHPWVSGTVVSGSEISRLFQFTSKRDITGEQRTIYGIKPSEREAGRCVRVAM